MPHTDELDEDVELAVTDVAYGGKGLARHNGLVVFVHGVLPGETVTAHISRRRRNYAEAGLVGVLEPSDQRMTPVCPLTESTVLGNMLVPCRSFFQANSAIANLVIREVSGLLTRTGAALAVDVYCGVGVFGLAARAAGNSRAAQRRAQCP